ncbi:MATE family efflux transporter [Pseudomarimonas salicorniae]|uniref:Multidrug-efflux transporter n=1 Tax=Pseudomarimonas salicorniae TaxID=2933270 RepID=A0ABT0GDH4_9GAMM|nr:MATE family efflux transporter [Lysobacter sp. CAU 1642]MCK7592483.1 MATE family efflux transporter [Lysobacter sp. CAU 1642]
MTADTGAPRLLRECRATFTLALPLVLGQLAAVAMNVVDSVLAGHHGALTLAGVAVGSALWSVVILLLLGILMAIPPSVSQLDGAGKRAEIAPLFRQALWLGLAISLALLGLVQFNGLLLPLLGIAEDVRPGASAFLGAVAWGAPALAVHFCCRYLSEGVGRTRPTMVFGIAGLILLVPLGYWLMHGGLGLPGYGAAGLGAATAIILWLQAVGFLYWLHRGPAYRDLGLFARFEGPDRALLAQLLRLGLPLGVAVMMEGLLFVASALVIGGMGALAVAAHQIAINIASVLFMVPLGVAMATTVRVGFAAGGRNAEGVRWACRAGFAITVVTQLFAAAILIGLGTEIAALYTREAAVLVAVAPLLWLAAAFQLSDGFQVAAAGCLRGLKDTRMPMLITAFAYWGVGMPAGIWFAFGYERGAPGMWAGLVSGLTVAALLLGGRLRRLLRRGEFAVQG